MIDLEYLLVCKRAVQNKIGIEKKRFSERVSSRQIGEYQEL